MASESPYNPRQDQELLAEILSYGEDPLGFVKMNYPWNVEGKPLEGVRSPRSWQLDVLEEIRDHIRYNRKRRANGLRPELFRGSTVSGRGVGKSALSSWLTDWHMSTHIGSVTQVTANTEQQLMTKTWPELGRWRTMALNAHWFDRTATSLHPQSWFGALVEQQLKIDLGYYYAKAMTWSKENSDAFAGTHNQNGEMIIFDEASGIPQPIWTVTEGFFTEVINHRYWLVFSNGRRNTGAFFETHHKHREMWHRFNVDARTVEENDAETYNNIIRQFGEDSDEARVEVKGMFPRQGDKQFISREVVQDAIERELAQDRGAALAMGVDVARFGGDASVICFRQGRDFRSIPYQRFKSLDTMQLAARVAEAADRYKPDGIFVDGGGVGGGVVDRLKEMRYNVIDVQAGAKPDDKDKYQNRRVELWGKMREWLTIGCIPDDDLLKDDLLGPEYEFTLAGQLRLETKEKMKDRGLASPDIADALALTFDRNLGRRDGQGSGRRREARIARGMDYSVI